MVRQLLIASLIICLSAAPIYSSQNESDSVHNQDLYNADNIRSFANHLKNEADYNRAAAEFDRLSFLLKPSPYADSALYFAGVCYLQGGNTELAINRFHKLRNEFSNSLLVPYSRIQQARAIYIQNQYDDVIWLLDSDRDGKSNSELNTLGARDLYCLSLARLDQWTEAENIACRLQPANGTSKPTEELCSLIREGKNLPTKSSFKAALLSTFIPGLGKFYAGRKADGAVAFLTIGTFVWQSVIGFREDGSSSVQGWIFGAFAASFHLGNIYGSTVSVHLYNEKLKHDYFHELEIKLIYNGP